MRVTTLLLCLTLVAALAGCGKAEKVLEQAAISKDLKQKGTLDLMKEAAEDDYQPPANGRLSEEQIQMYMKVREHEKQIVQVARKEAETHAKKAEGKEKSLAGMMAGLKTLGSVADMVTADIRAAKELGFNTAEYQWVKEKVLEASGAAYGEKLSESFSTMMDTQVETLKKQLEEAKDDTTRQFLQDALKGAEDARAEMAKSAEQQDPAIAYNKQILSKHESALNALAHEFAKWEGKEGETQAAVQKWEQELNKSTAQANQ
jgi:hypothetical protein